MIVETMINVLSNLWWVMFTASVVIAQSFVYRLFAVWNLVFVAHGFHFAAIWQALPEHDGKNWET